MFPDNPPTPTARRAFRAAVLQSTALVRAYRGSEDDNNALVDALIALEIADQPGAAGLALALLNRAITRAYGVRADTDVEQVLARATEGGAAVITASPYLFVPPDPQHDGPQTGRQQGWRETKTAPKLAELIAFLQGKGIFYDDLILVRGAVSRSQMRQEPYILVDIPRLHAQIAVCDQIGEASFAAQGTHTPQFWATASKPELAMTEGIRRIPYAPLWTDELWSHVMQGRNTEQSLKTGFDPAQIRLYAERPPITLDHLDRAIRLYRAANGGKNPAAWHGDATGYFGYPQTWKSIEGLFLSLNHEQPPQARGLRDAMQQAYGGDRHNWPRTFTAYLAQRGFIDAGKPDLTLASLDKAITAYHTEQGHYPLATSGDASPCFGYEESWAAVNSCFPSAIKGRYARGLAIALTEAFGNDREKWPKTIASYLILRGFVTAKPDLTLERLDDAITAYRLSHDGRNPTARPQDATDCFGYNENWANIESIFGTIQAGRSGRGMYAVMVKAYGNDRQAWPKSLSEYLIKRGFAEGKPKLTLALLEQGVRAYMEKHDGQHPAMTGNASPYFGYTETWDAINGNIYIAQQGSDGRGLAEGMILKYGPDRAEWPDSLYQYLLREGMATEKPDLTLEAIDTAIKRFGAAYNGALPLMTSGDASNYFGYDTSWSQIHYALYTLKRTEKMSGRGLRAAMLKEYGTDETLWPNTLAEYLYKRGFAEPPKPALDWAMLDRAIQSYRQVNHGKNPVGRSRVHDATAYFGYTEDWFDIDKAISSTRNRPSRGLRESFTERYGTDKETWPTSLKHYCEQLPPLVMTPPPPRP